MLHPGKALLKASLTAVAAGAILCGSARAQSSSDAAQWLQRIYTAGQKVSYTGVFFYQQGDSIETSRITRLVDGSGVRERMESLDGTPREVVRVNDEVRCFLLSSMTVKVDGHADTKPFPAVPTDRIKDIADSYEIREGGMERIAGYDSRAIVLQPKDTLRYGHKLWAESQTGLLLKAKTYNEKNETVEQFSFTQLQIGGKIDKEQVKSRFASKGKDWRVETSGMTETDLSRQGWTLKNLPAGFKKTTQMKRRVGANQDVGHMVVSDGLAAVSVFIEPLGSKPPPAGPARRGALNVYTRTVDDHLVTVIGEAPPQSVKLIAHAVEHRAP